MKRQTKRRNYKFVGRLWQTRMLSGFAFVLSAKGAQFIASLGHRPRIGEKANISAEGAAHFPPIELTTRIGLIRTFSAGLLSIPIPGAMRQADDDMAPLVLSAHRSAEPRPGDASDKGEKNERQIVGRLWQTLWRLTQTPNDRGFRPHDFSL